MVFLKLKLMSDGNVFVQPLHAASWKMMTRCSVARGAGGKAWLMHASMVSEMLRQLHVQIHEENAANRSAAREAAALALVSDRDISGAGGTALSGEPTRAA